MIPFQFNDGGRAAAGYKGQAGDCVTRAIAIATGRPYQQVYDAINELCKTEKRSKRKRGKSDARAGVHKDVYHRYLLAAGATWVPTMAIGQGCTVHLRNGELPAARLVVSLSRHLAAVMYGTLHDLSDCSRGGTRCVYGYYKIPSPLK